MTGLLRRWTAAAILQGLVWAGVTCVALALPVVQLSLAWQFERGTLASDAHARAYVIGQRVAANPQMWPFETQRLTEHLEHTLLAGSAPDRRAVVDVAGEVIAENREPGQLRWPLITHREALYDHGRVAGWVQLERSLRDHVEQAVALGAASVLVGSMLALLLTRLPLGRLRDVEDELAHKAYHDDLTGLYNRDAFRRLSAERVAQAARDRRRLGVLFLDLDRFKNINDTLGHDAGDDALRSVAERLRGGTRAGDVVARLSGDEFAVLIDSPPADASLLADKLLHRFEAPFAIRGRQWHLGCSVGMALYPEHAGDADRLLACADTAMLAAKSSGRSTSRVYDTSMEESAALRIEIEEDLHGALQRGEFVLHYQPLVELASGRVKGAEALMRWRHPKRGQVSPMEFIPVLEDMGLIHAVGQWSLEESCRQMKSWLDQQLPLQQVSVNVSPLQFARHDEFVEVVRQALAAAALPPRHLQLEVTEGMLMGDGARSLATLEALQRIGVELAIDDFGTGYSSLAYLRSFPVSVLKIDRSFVRDMQASEQSASIVRAVVQMAHSLNLQVTAEGIETTEQGDALRTLGCNTGQGYALGRPMPAADLVAHLQHAEPALSTAG